MSKYRSLLTAYSSHSFCFICKRSSKNNRLYQVKIDSIIEAFLEHRIFIKRHARSCKRHLDDSGLIVKDEFFKIPTKLKSHNAQTVLLLEVLAFKRRPICLGMFDQFRYLNTLSEEHCYKVTGWSKKQFVDFSSYITSMNDNSGRTKEQLIALYRYWLRKGLDQYTLSALFSQSKTQSQISKYLDQARRAIYNDFVPFFLGAKSRTRDFFLKHNNIMVTELHEIDKDCLVVVIDGTYTRLEKSINNQFQYACWSEQKMDLLIKPFGICCADGYFIDCYGPFEAHFNDAQIFEYILKTDFDLINILLPEKTLALLDRGFRNIFQKLINEFKIMARIPTCKQIEKEKIKSVKNDEEEKKNTQLTAIQTSDSRLVTKCRFIIEQKFSDLKNKQALDNIRNTEAGHIQIDYRIACAMSNFVHKPVCPDGDNALDIAKKIKERTKIKENNLDFLLRKHLNTKTIPQIELSKVEDFPKLSKTELKQEIFFGSFQLKLCESYVGDLIKNGKAYIIDDNFVRKIPVFLSNEELLTCKIIAVEITSRHKRSQIKKPKLSKDSKKINQKSNFIKSFRTVYKVFIQYLPGKNEPSSIKGYVCSCKSGQKIAGCCVHVASLIYYLSFSKYSEIIVPADYLNSIFINMDALEAPNRPRLVKRKRRKFKKDNDLNGQSDFNFENDQQDIQPCQKKNQKKILKHSLNNILKPIRKRKIKNSKLENNLDERKWSTVEQYITLSEFKSHVPAWGGYINYNGKKVMLTNTCTIDYYLFAFWYLSKIKSQSVFDNLNEKEIISQIINKIDNLDWNTSKELWINKIMKYNQPLANNTLSLFGSQLEFFICYFFEYQRYKIVQKCDVNCIKNENHIYKENLLNIFFKKFQNSVKLYCCISKKCDECQTEIKHDIVFYKKPKFLFIISNGENIFINDIPMRIEIDNCFYQFLCTTVYNSEHFLGIFLNNDNLYEVDDLGKRVRVLKKNVEKGKQKDDDNSAYVLFTTVSLFYFI